eukprot:761843-Hanusia_phi.AAC.3
MQPVRLADTKVANSPWKHKSHQIRSSCISMVLAFNLRPGRGRRRPGGPSSLAGPGYPIMWSVGSSLLLSRFSVGEFAASTFP